MNKKVQIAVAAGLFGLAVGSIGGYIVGDRRNAEKYREISDEEIRVMREKYRGYREDLADKVSDERRILQEEQEYLAATSELIQKKYKVENVYSDLRALDEDQTEEDLYEELVTDYNPEDEVEEETGVYIPGDPLSQLGEVDENRKEPYFIDEEVYSLNEKHYTHAMVTYFINDNLLIDETDQVIHDVEGLFGKTLPELQLHNDIDLAYIRNNRIQLEIELVIERESFQDFVERVGMNGS